MKQILKNIKLLSICLLVVSFLGCEDDDEVLPEVVSGFTFTLNAETATVTFINISEEASAFKWNFGDGETSTLINPVKTYSESGTYTVSLEASNVAGAKKVFEDEITIVILGEPILPITFDDSTVDYTPTLFGGTTFEVIVNPDASGTNASTSNVGAITNSGNAFEGLFFDLATPINLAEDKTIKMNFWSESPISLLLKLEEGTGADVEISADHGGTGWEEVMFDFDSESSYSRFTFFVDGPGAATGTYYIDDITQSMTMAPPFDAGLLSNGDFSDGNTGWIGSGLNVVTEGDNSFNSVDVAMAGNPFDVNLSQVVEIVQGTNYILTFDASSDRVRTILAGIGLNEAPFTNTAPTVNLTTDTQTFTLQLSAADFGGANSRILFDMGAEVGAVIIDNVSLVEGGDGSDSNMGGGDPFDSGLLVNGDFEDGAGPWTIGVGSDPVPLAMENGNSFYSVNVETAGNSFDVNMSQQLEIVQGATYTLTFDAWSDRDRNIIAGIGLSDGDFSNNSVAQAITSTRTTYTLTLEATGFGASNARVLFDSGAEVGLVNIDNVSLTLDDLGGGQDPFDSGLLTNGDFENGATPWTIGVGSDPVPLGMDNGNNFYSVNVENAGNSFDVNMSQQLEIVQGSTYILTFDAWSDRDRNIVAGIGLSDGDFSNNSVSQAITATRSTYSLTLEATGFGAANARVLFDSGAEVGLVNIDNVSLVLDGGSSGGGGCTGSEVAATSLPLDFEGCESFVSSFSSIGDGGVVVSLDANPSKSGINTSDNVMKVVRASGINRWGGVQNSFPAGVIDITTQVFKIKVYSSIPDVTYRFELALDPQTDPVTGNPAPVFRQVSGGADTWTEIEFTFTGLPATPTTYNQLVIKPDNPEGSDGELTAEERVFYFDDLRLE